MRYAKETSLLDTAESLEMRAEVMQQNFEAGKSKMDASFTTYCQINDEMDSAAHKLVNAVGAVSLAASDPGLFLDPTAMVQMVQNIYDLFGQFESYETQMTETCKEINSRVKWRD